jgi:hypothetical protein
MHMALPKAIKIILGVLIGFITWYVVASVGNLVVRGLGSGYAEAEAAMRFTLPMMLARLGLGAVSSVAAGFVCAACVRSVPSSVKFLAFALVVFFIPVHYALWAQFPLWYHVVFLVSLAPLAIVGARLARPFASGGRSAA